VGRGLPRKFLTFEWKIVHFGAFWGRGYEAQQSVHWGMGMGLFPLLTIFFHFLSEVAVTGAPGTLTGQKTPLSILCLIYTFGYS